MSLPVGPSAKLDPITTLRVRLAAATQAALGVEHAGVDPMIHRSQHADFQADLAMTLARTLKRSPRDVATAIVERLVRSRACEALVARRKDRHRLAAAQLEQDVVFGIEMEGRDRIGRGDEDEALELQHLARYGPDHRLEFGEPGVEEIAIDRVLLDELQNHPGSALLDRTDRLGDAEAVCGSRGGIEAY